MKMNIGRDFQPILFIAKLIQPKFDIVNMKVKFVNEGDPLNCLKMAVIF